MTLPPGSAPETPPKTSASKWRGAILQFLSLAISLTLTCGLLLLLLWSPFGGSHGDETEPPAADAVQVMGPRTLSIKADSLLAKKLTVATATKQEITAPVLTVTGSVVARLGSGKDPAETRWDFNSPELASAYADWLKARADTGLAEGQLEKIKSLTEARLSAATDVAERLRNLVKAGTDSIKDLKAAEADLRQALLQGQKDVFEAETNLSSINRTRATLERQIFQAGMDPALLGRTADGTAILVADVPEARISLVQPGLECAVKFFAFKGETVDAVVSTLSPNVSKERRTMRVFFELKDKQARFKPGMFAEIGLKVDPRPVTLIPADAVLHVGRNDYVLAGGDQGTWRIVEVTVGEVHGSDIEVHSGVAPDENVLGTGAILLKPLVVRALQK